MRNSLLLNLQKHYPSFMFTNEEETYLNNMEKYLCDLEKEREFEYNCDLNESVLQYLGFSELWGRRFPINSCEFRRAHLFREKDETLIFTEVVNSITINSSPPHLPFQDFHKWVEDFDIRVTNFMQSVIFGSLEPKMISSYDEIEDKIGCHNMFFHSLNRGRVPLLFRNFHPIRFFYGVQNKKFILCIPKSNPMIWEMDYMIPEPNGFRFSLEPKLLNPEVIELFELRNE